MLFFPQEVQCFYKIRTCHSNFTVRNFSGVLHALLPNIHLILIKIHLTFPIVSY